MSEAGPHDVGSLGEEATKLLGALSGWAREQAADVGDGLAGLTSQAAASAHDLNDHLATGAAECTVCPVCQAVRAVRDVSPEVMVHLSAAIASLAQAATAFVGTPPRTTRDGGDVEHVDVSDEWPDEQ